MLEIFWILLVPFVLITFCLDYFKVSEGGPNPTQVLKRVVIALIMLVSFDEVMLLIASVSEGIIDKVNGTKGFNELFSLFGERASQLSFNVFKLRESIVLVLGFLSYCISYVSVIVCEVLSTIVYSLLFVCSPLLILCYVNDRTKNITASMYSSIIQIQVWKILWSILGLMLLKISLASDFGSGDSFLMTVALNLAIAVLMLFIPFATSSLLKNGLSDAAGKMSLMSSVPIAGYFHERAKKHIGKPIANTADKIVKTPIQAVRHPIQTTQNIVQSGKNTVTHIKDGARQIKSGAKEITSRRPERKSPRVNSNTNKKVIKVDFKNKRRIKDE